MLISWSITLTCHFPLEFAAFQAISTLTAIRTMTSCSLAAQHVGSNPLSFIHLIISCRTRSSRLSPDASRIADSTMILVLDKDGSWLDDDDKLATPTPSSRNAVILGRMTTLGSVQINEEMHGKVCAASWIRYPLFTSAL